MSELRFAVHVAPSIPAKVPGRETTAFWSPISCTLIYSAKEAVLVDTPITVDQTSSLIAWIQQIAPGRKLSFIFITHGHFDHFGGISMIMERFPAAVPVATAATAKHMEQQLEETYFKNVWEARFPNQIHQPHALAQALPTNSFRLESKWEFSAIECGHTDTYESSILWVPALRLAVCGDVVYGQMHQMLMEANTKAKREEWIRAISKLETLDPAYVVPGHKQPGEPDATWHLAETKSDEVMNLYPERFNPGAVRLSAAGVFLVPKELRV
ncbi:metallo-beta-lactamase domain protein [Colletotrichum asianum]